MKRVIKKVLFAIAISCIPVFAPVNKVYAVIDTVIAFNYDSVVDKNTDNPGYGNVGNVLHDGSLNSAKIMDMDLDMFNADSPTADINDAVGSFVYTSGHGNRTCIGQGHSTGIGLDNVPHKYTIIKSENGQEFSLKSICLNDSIWLSPDGSITIKNIYIDVYDGNTYIGRAKLDESHYTYVNSSERIDMSKCMNAAYCNHITRVVISSDASNGGNYIGFNSVEVADPTSYSVAAPTSKVDASGDKIDIKAPDGASIYYTTNGSTPTINNDELYTNPFAISGSCTVKAIAVKNGIRSNILSNDYKKASKPTVNVTDSGVPRGTKVKLQAADAGAKIYYTTDSSTPTTSLTPYDSASDGIAINSTTTINAIAVANGMMKSDMLSKTYTVTGPSVPKASIGAGSVLKGTKVSLTADAGYTIYYTLDDTVPTAQSQAYNGPISINDAVTIKAIAIKDGDSSDVATYTYTIQKAANPTSNLVCGTINKGSSLKLNTATPNATIYYTMDGTDPRNSISAIKYEGEDITIDISYITIKAVARCTGMEDSEVVSFNYNVQKAANPISDTIEGTVDKGKVVKLSTLTQGATIHYTTDGTTPTASSPEYPSAGIAINDYSVNIKAIATCNGMYDSDVVSFTYKAGVCNPPKVSLTENTVTIGSAVTLTADAGDTIRYTTDGTIPTDTNGYDYNGPITLNKSMKIIAVAFNSKKIQSSSLKENYTVVLHDPIITLNGDMVYISESDAVNKIYYTLDGTDPTNLSSVYNNGGIEIDNPATLKVFAVGSDCNSKIMSKTFSQVQMPVGDNVDKMPPGGNIYFVGETGAQLYYTLDGSDPDKSCNLYDPRYGIQIMQPETVKVRAYKDGELPSKIFSKAYDIQVEQPTINIDGDKVTLSDSTPGVTLYYSTDGGKTFNPYNSVTGITVQNATTLNVYAEKYGFKSSVVTKNLDQATSLTVDKTSSEVAPGDIIQLIGDLGSDIYYTIDGSTPTKSSIKYDDKIGIKIEKPTTIKAIAFEAGKINSEIFSKAYGIKIAPVVWSIKDNKISLGSSTPGVDIYYTTDGTVPNANSNKYDGKSGILIDKDCEIKAVAVGYGSSSEVMDKSFIKAQNPVSMVPQGKVGRRKVIHFSFMGKGIKIYYTINGTNPTTSSMLYDESKGIEVDKSMVIKAITVTDDMLQSDVITLNYTVDQTSAPTSNIPSGEVKGGTDVTLTVPTGAAVYYTTDGSTPTKMSNLYTGAIRVDKSMVIKAAAFRDDMLDSDVLTLKYTVLGSKNKNSSSSNSASNTISAQPALSNAAVETSNNGEVLILTPSDTVWEENDESTLPSDNTVTAQAVEENNNTVPTKIEDSSKGRKEISKKTIKDSKTKNEAPKKGNLGSILAKTAAVAAVIGGFIFFIIFKRRKEDGK